MLSAPGAIPSSSSPWGSAGGPLGRLYGPKNVLYVRNLSPLVTEEHLRAIFSHCAEVLRVEFKTLPGGAGGGGRYCELEFADSAGITAASQLNGTELLGLAMQVSVLNPGSSGPSTENFMKSVTPLPTPLPVTPAGGPVVLPAPVQPLGGMAAAAAAAAAGLAGGSHALAAPGGIGVTAANPAMAAAAAAALPGSTAGLLPAGVAATPTPVTAVEIAMQNHLANLQAVQAAALQAKQLAARKKSELGLGVAVTAVDGRLPPAQSLVSGVLVAEPETDQLERSCFVQGFPNEYDEKEVGLLLNDLGKISGIRLGVKNDGSKYAIVEFESAQDAAAILGMDGSSIGTCTLTVKKSASLVSFRDPDGVLFEVPAPPILSQIKQQQQLLQSPEQQKEQIELRERRIANAKASIERRLLRAREQRETEREGEGATDQQEQPQEREKRRQSGSASRSRSLSKDRRSNTRRQRRDASLSLSAPSRSLSPAGGPPRGPSRSKERHASTDSRNEGPRRPLLRAPGSQAAASALKERLKRAASAEGEEGPHSRSHSSIRGFPSPKRRSRSIRRRSPPQQQQQVQGRSESIKGRTPSPRERSPLQRAPSPSPKRRSQSPRRPSPMQHRRSPPHQRRSPMQQRRSLSPRRRSVSPRKRSPSAQQRRSPISPRERRMRAPSMSPRRGKRSPSAARAAAAAPSAAAASRGAPRSRSGSPHGRLLRDREELRFPATAARRRLSRSPSPLERKGDMSGSPSPPRKGRSRSPWRQGRQSRSPQRRSLSPSPPRRPHGRGVPPLKGSPSRSPSPTFRRSRVSRSPSPRWRRSRSPGGPPAPRGPSRMSPDWRPSGGSPATRGPRGGQPTHPRGPSPVRGPQRPYSGSRERSLSPPVRVRGPQMGGGPIKRGRSPSLHLRRRSPSPRRGELRSWRRSPGSHSRSPPRRFQKRRTSPGVMGPYGDPRGLPPPGPPFRERDVEWGRLPPPPMGGPRPYSRDIRLPRRGPLMRDDGPPRRQQQHRGAPPPAVDRYKSQSRSLSEEAPVDRASSGSPAAGGEREKGSEREERRGEEGRSLSREKGPPSSLPLQSRLGDLRRRLQSKRGEPTSQ